MGASGQSCVVIFVVFSLWLDMFYLWQIIKKSTSLQLLCQILGQCSCVSSSKNHHGAARLKDFIEPMVEEVASSEGQHGRY